MTIFKPTQNQCITSSSHAHIRQAATTPANTLISLLNAHAQASTSALLNTKTYPSSHLFRHTLKTKDNSIVEETQFPKPINISLTCKTLTPIYNHLTKK